MLVRSMPTTSAFELYGRSISSKISCKPYYNPHKPLVNTKPLNLNPTPYTLNPKPYTPYTLTLT